MNMFIKSNKEHIKFILYSLLTLIVILFIHSNIYSFDFTIRLHDYLYSQWVFSYDYGFVRRALPGEMLSILGIDPTYRHVRLVSILLLISLFYLFARITYIFLKNLKLDNKDIIIFSVCIFSLSFLASQWVRELSRFDHVGQIILLTSILLILKNARNSIVLAFILLSLPVMALTHEAMLIFFVPTLAFIYYQKYRKISHIFLIGIESTLLLVAVVIYGKMSSFQVNSIIKTFMYYEHFQSYAVSTSLLTLKENFVTNYQTFFETKAYLKIFFTFLFCSPILLFIKKSTDKKTFLLILFFSASPLALTLIAFDYIRWIALFLFNLSIIFMSLAIMNNIDRNLISSNFMSFKKLIYSYAFVSLLLGPLGIGNTFINFYEVNFPWEKREKWDQALLVKLNDPIPLSNIRLSIDDVNSITQLYFLNQENIKQSKLNKAVINHYIKASKKGSTDAQNTLGFFYFYGIHTSINYCSALEMFKVAAQGQNKHALYNLSLLYRDGICIEKNIKKANNLLIQASAHENDLAKFMLAINYLHGNNGFVKNKKEALKILTELKSKGNLPAEISLEALKLE
ncbi:sel1 repeat family protein [Acinetobacter sp. Tr-809]|uniref:tetratricopeptide repeat protein n=1 Tax=Acinetobacter sp. Tr-809 TaxID=2608324 RepID=UPI001424A7CD|nr:tetratricopeptide repeat protein [Acinetobacter sp. Tr-809]NIE96425.1 sel1 repeat family protein [Acinetobacter sp. Tr-809]